MYLTYDVKIKLVSDSNPLSVAYELKDKAEAERVRKGIVDALSEATNGSADRFFNMGDISARAGAVVAVYVTEVRNYDDEWDTPCDEPQSEKSSEVPPDTRPVDVDIRGITSDGKGCDGAECIDQTAVNTGIHCIIGDPTSCGPTAPAEADADEKKEGE